MIRRIFSVIGGVALLFVMGCGTPLSSVEKAGAAVTKDKQGNIIEIKFAGMPEFSDEKVAALAADMKTYKGLTTLDFSGTDLSDDGLSTVLDIYKSNASIQNLLLTDTSVSDSSVDALVEALNARMMVRLAIKGTGIGEEAKTKLKATMGFYWKDE